MVTPEVNAVVQEIQVLQAWSCQFMTTRTAAKRSVETGSHRVSTNPSDVVPRGSNRWPWEDQSSRQLIPPKNMCSLTMQTFIHAGGKCRATCACRVVAVFPEGNFPRLLQRTTVVVKGSVMSPREAQAGRVHTMGPRRREVEVFYVLWPYAAV